MVGGINVNEADQTNGTYGYGVGIHAEHKGNGYAAEAVLLLMRFMFDERRFQKCEYRDELIFGMTAEEFHEFHPKLKPTL